MASGAEKTEAGKGRGGDWLLFGLVGLVAVAGGFTLPRFFHSEGSPEAVHKEETAKPTIVPFGDLVVNLGEERLTRYLRVKLILVVEGTKEKEINEHIQKKKAYLKSWLIGYLADQSLQEVSRAAGVNRVRREIRDQFNAMLYPDGSEKIQDVLFDEFVVQ